MKALIRDESRVACPFCTGLGFFVYRREVAPSSVVRHRCRCEACGESFTFDLDRHGKLSDDSAGPAKASA